MGCYPFRCMVSTTIKANGFVQAAKKGFRTLIKKEVWISTLNLKNSSNAKRYRVYLSGNQIKYSKIVLRSN